MSHAEAGIRLDVSKEKKAPTPKPETRATPDQQRQGIMRFLTTGKIGHALKTVGFLLAVEAQSHQLVRVDDPAVSNVPQGVAMSDQSRSEGSPWSSGIHYGSETPEPVIDQAEILAIQNELDHDRAGGRERRLTLPHIEGTQEHMGFHQETVEGMLRDAYPHFLVRAANVRSITCDSERESMGREYGVRGVEEAHATHAPGAETSEVVMHASLLDAECTGDLCEARFFQLVLTHELAHTADPTNNIDSSPAERLATLRELEEIVTHDEFRVRFPYPESIHNLDETEETRIRMIEYFAESIAYAVDVHLDAGEDWVQGYSRYLQRNFQATPQQADRTARFAVGYIRRHAPEYDQHRGYAARMLYAQRLTAEREVSQMGRAVHGVEQITKPAQDQLEQRFTRTLNTIDDVELRQELIRIFADHQNWGHLVQTEPRPASSAPRLPIEARRGLTRWRDLTAALMGYTQDLHSRTTDEAHRAVILRRALRSISEFNQAYAQTPQGDRSRLTQAALGYLNSSVSEVVSLRGIDE